MYWGHSGQPGEGGNNLRIFSKDWSGKFMRKKLKRSEYQEFTRNSDISGPWLSPECGVVDFFSPGISCSLTFWCIYIVNVHSLHKQIWNNYTFLDVDLFLYTLLLTLADSISKCCQLGDLKATGCVVRKMAQGLVLAGSLLLPCGLI